MIPRMTHRSIHEALWWSIDIQSSIFGFQASNVLWKLQNEKTGTETYTEENKFLPLI